MDNNVLLLQDSFNPQKVFNLNKYYEFTYKTKLKGLDDVSFRNLEEVMKKHELQT